MFEKMSNKELKAYIKGCHSSKDYDSYFEAACFEANNRGLYDHVKIELSSFESRPFKGMAYNREF